MKPEFAYRLYRGTISFIKLRSYRGTILCLSVKRNCLFAWFWDVNMYVFYHPYMVNINIYSSADYMFKLKQLLFCQLYEDVRLQQIISNVCNICAYIFRFVSQFSNMIASLIAMVMKVSYYTRNIFMDNFYGKHWNTFANHCRWTERQIEGKGEDGFEARQRAVCVQTELVSWSIESICRVHALEYEGDRGWMQRVMGCRINPVKKDCLFLSTNYLLVEERSRCLLALAFSVASSRWKCWQRHFDVWPPLRSRPTFPRRLIRSRNVNLEHYRRSVCCGTILGF